MGWRPNGPDAVARTDVAARTAAHAAAGISVAVGVDAAAAGVYHAATRTPSPPRSSRALSRSRGRRCLAAMARPASSPARPRRRPGRALAPNEVRAVWTYVQTVLASLAIVLCGSWRPFSPAVADPFSLAEGSAVDEAGAPPPAAEAVTAAVEAAWKAKAPAAERAAATIRLSNEIRWLVPGARDTLIIDPETLWLARCMYSESDLPHEQELVAWVVRNRVATGYRGRRTYRDVVLDPAQFSAFNWDSGRRTYYASLMPWSAAPGWRRTLAIAAFVRLAPWSRRPFPVGVRHFYSPVSMVGRSMPAWAIGRRAVQPDRLYPVDPYRFRFLALYEGRPRRA